MKKTFSEGIAFAIFLAKCLTVIAVGGAVSASAGPTAGALSAVVCIMFLVYLSREKRFNSQ